LTLTSPAAVSGSKYQSWVLCRLLCRGRGWARLWRVRPCAIWCAAWDAIRVVYQTIPINRSLASERILAGSRYRCWPTSRLAHPLWGLQKLRMAGVGL